MENFNNLLIFEVITLMNKLSSLSFFAVERSSHFLDMVDFHTFLQDVFMSEGIDMGM